MTESLSPANRAAHVLFVQSFGLGAAGGGSRILRSLLKEAPVDWTSVSTMTPSPRPDARERHVSYRRRFGRLDRTRLHPVLDTFDHVARGRLVRSLERLATDVGASAVHGLPHGTDFLAAHAAAQNLALPYYLSVHDDLRHTARARPDLAMLLARLGHVWRSATHRFVISEELGEEYERRYGREPWDLVSDAAEPAPARARPSGSCVVYFNSSFVPYRANFAALISALASLSDEVDARLILRGADEPAVDWPVPIPLELLPFADDGDVALDKVRADVLYLPLPFEAEMVDLVRWSLSTKMVGFLAAGRPILYHGPRQAAAARLLGEHGAAIIVDSLEPSHVSIGLREALDRRHDLVANAEALLRHRFAPAQVRHRFWQTLVRA